MGLKADSSNLESQAKVFGKLGMACDLETSEPVPSDTFLLNQKFKTPETGGILIQTTTVAKLMFWDAKPGPATVAQRNKACVSVSNFFQHSTTND